MSRAGTRPWDAADDLETTEDMVAAWRRLWSRTIPDSWRPCSVASPERRG